jgi:hypothetical protein
MNKGLIKMLCAATIMASLSIQARQMILTGGVLSDQTHQVFPDGCGNPYIDFPRFVTFFDGSISMMAAKRGHDAKGVSDLFAVLALREEMAYLFPNYTEESPIDRMIVAQLCQYQKIRALEMRPGSTPLLIAADDERLADHLALVSSKLYLDSRQLMKESLSDRAKRKKEENFLASKQGEIWKAREKGRDKASDLIEEAL